MQIYFGTYEGWCGLFCLVFGIIGFIIYMLYQDVKDTIENLELQSNSYAAQLRAEKDISNNLEKEVIRLRKNSIFTILMLLMATGLAVKILVWMISQRLLENLTAFLLI